MDRARDMLRGCLRILKRLVARRVPGARCTTSQCSPRFFTRARKDNAQRETESPVFLLPRASRTYIHILFENRLLLSLPYLIGLLLSTSYRRLRVAASFYTDDNGHHGFPIIQIPINLSAAEAGYPPT